MIRFALDEFMKSEYTLVMNVHTDLSALANR
jgi:hypothetical protein